MMIIIGIVVGYFGGLPLDSAHDIQGASTMTSRCFEKYMFAAANDLIRGVNCKEPF